VATALRDERTQPREQVSHRTRLLAADGRALPVLVVNMSAGGFMARCDEPFGEGDPVRLLLPVLGVVRAEVRWALGGRVGCQLDRTIAQPIYLELLAAMGR
jgi:hypothetical protein